MATNKLVLEGQTFQIARRSLIVTCKLFLENPNLFSTLDEVRSQVSEAHFRLFLREIEGVTMEIELESAIDLESLRSEFRFIELGRRVGKFVSQHPQIEVARLKSVVLDLQRLVGHNRELCQFVEANERTKTEEDAQLEGLRGMIDEVAKKRLQERKKVSGLQKVIGEFDIRLVKQMRLWNGG
jgi:hypothetical protein